MIGRERPGQQSEVAALIQQTLEQERRQRELLEQQYAHYDADDDEVTAEHGQCAISRRFINTHSSESGCMDSEECFLTIDKKVLAF